jgi:hypothetical protein
VYVQYCSVRALIPQQPLRIPLLLRHDLIGFKPSHLVILPGPPSHGQLYFRKVAKNFGQSAFLSAREIEHGRFRALFAVPFWPRMQNGRASPKSSIQQSVFSVQRNQDQRLITTEDTEGTENRAGEKAGGGGDYNQ